MTDRTPRLHLPMLKPEDVIPHLGAAHHWREGRSARLITETWFEAQHETRGLPVMIRYVLDQSPRLQDAELVDAFLERRIDLGSRGRPSQADALAILSLPDGLAVMAIEGKVTESFGPLVGEWRKPLPSGTEARLSRLCATLGIDPATTDALRYQLFHRTASAIYEAKRYRARTAIMMVHSFDPHDTGIQDYCAFAQALGMPDAAATRLSGPFSCEGVDLFLGWCADRASNEGFSIVNGRKSDAGMYDED